MSRSAPLARRLGLKDAIALGLGSMIGAGIFSAFGPAAAAAGGLLLVGLVIAGLLAFLNATATAQLAAQYPTSGGTYTYGRERLGPWPGFLAGWGFVIGKTASAAAMALTFAAYAVPEGWQRPVAALAVLGVSVVNLRGVTRTALAARLIVSFVIIVLLVVILAGISSQTPPTAGRVSDSAHPYGILQSAGLLFFAFAGYARIATMGEEVKNPRRNIPRAILIALVIALLLYVAVALTALHALGSSGLANTPAPLSAVVNAAGWAWASPLVRIGAALASLGALLALLAGIGRTTLAMARTGDLPAWLSSVHPRFHVPHHADLVLAIAVCLLVLTIDLRGAIGFSSFGVLVYYSIANAAAFTQSGEHRRYPRWMQAIGLVGCLLVAFTLPWQSIAAGLALFAIGATYRAWRVRHTTATET